MERLRVLITCSSLLRHKAGEPDLARAMAYMALSDARVYSATERRPRDEIAHPLAELSRTLAFLGDAGGAQEALALARREVAWAKPQRSARYAATLDEGLAQAERDVPAIKADLAFAQSLRTLDQPPTPPMRLPAGALPLGEDEAAIWRYLEDLDPATPQLRAKQAGAYMRLAQLTQDKSRAAQHQARAVALLQILPPAQSDAATFTLRAAALQGLAHARRAADGAYNVEADLKEATRFARSAYWYAPQDRDVRYNYAVVAAETAIAADDFSREAEQATFMLKKVVADEPGLRPLLARVLAAEKNPGAEALAEAETLLAAMAGVDPDLLAELAQVQIRRGRSAEALTTTARLRATGAIPRAAALEVDALLRKAADADAAGARQAYDQAYAVAVGLGPGADLARVRILEARLQKERDFGAEAAAEAARSRAAALVAAQLARAPDDESFLRHAARLERLRAPRLVPRNE